jgi:PKD repeat protein
MFRKLFFAILCTLLFADAYSQCMGGIRFRYTNSAQLVWFQDSSSTGIANPVKEYVHWDFGDGTTDTMNGMAHSFPSPLMYWVKKEVKYHESGNPSNNCVKLDSIQVDASLFVPSTPACSPVRGMRVRWLSGLTYGVSAYYNGCTPNVYEIVIDTAAGVSVSSTPMTSGMYTSHSNYFTYTLPFVHNYSVTQHASQTVPSVTVEGYIHPIAADSIPVTPGSCHASFFLAQDTLNHNDWTIYNYSTATAPGMPGYLWDFGDGTTDTAMSPVHHYSSVGNYTVCLSISSGGCSDTYCDTAFFDHSSPGEGVQNLRTVRVPVGITGPPDQQPELVVFPDPAGNELNVRFPGSMNSAGLKVTAYDNLGRALSIPQQLTGRNELQFDVSGLKAGIYTIRAVDGKSVVSERFIKQ